MTSEQIVDAIISDLAGRSAIGKAWEQIDADIQAEIRAIWLGYIEDKSEVFFGSQGDDPHGIDPP